MPYGSTLCEYRSSLEAFATRMDTLAENLVEILALKVNMKSNHFQENYLPKSSFIRLNRYPPCPISSEVFGLLAHCDTSFLTILYQDSVGGLQLMKDGKWIDVKPNPSALVVNIGDLFQVNFHHFIYVL
jgi:gibberellin 2beta-dioxygenase